MMTSDEPDDDDLVLVSRESLEQYAAMSAAEKADIADSMPVITGIIRNCLTLAEAHPDKAMELHVQAGVWAAFEERINRRLN